MLPRQRKFSGHHSHVSCQFHVCLPRRPPCQLHVLSSNRHANAPPDCLLSPWTRKNVNPQLSPHLPHDDVGCCRLARASKMTPPRRDTTPLGLVKVFNEERHAAQKGEDCSMERFQGRTMLVGVAVIGLRGTQLLLGRRSRHQCERDKAFAMAP